MIAKHQIPDTDDEHREQQPVGLNRRRPRGVRKSNTIGHEEVEACTKE